ncbi:MAG: M1 family aminopeptidase, partial [Acidiferrobacterales bacterium]|nr:M1 family aminopeptidase [Acidiferrobacterales bacterium]
MSLFNMYMQHRWAPAFAGAIAAGSAAVIFAGADMALAAEVVNHELAVRLDPGRGRIEVRDTITFTETAPPGKAYTFFLHAGLQPNVRESGDVLTRTGRFRAAVPVDQYRLKLPRGHKRVTVYYGGVIQHPLATTRAGAKIHTDTAGTISPQGIFLGGASYWYPQLENTLLTFALNVDLPSGWRAISQGVANAVPPEDGRSQVRWVERQPQEQIVLVAGRYHTDQRSANGYAAQVWLRAPDAVLAQRYLEATIRYVDLYSRLLGPYPYKKFALVENFWESGYGMPSFALLGSRVIRLPFILESSYPHEILHNWWGNGVYVSSGWNWSEGLTAYLADHLAQEQREEGATYRRGVLQKYTDYVSQGEDFPLTAFVGAHTDVGQAVGYGKSLMFFHMLRLRLGDRVFVEGLRRFYAANLFRLAGYDELKRAFEVAGGTELSDEFTQWVQRTGAPRLEVRNVNLERMPHGFRLSGVLQQAQPDSVYALAVPLAVQLAGHDVALITTVGMNARKQRFDLSLAARPTLLQVDPRFDLFRRLDVRELAPALGQLYAAQRLLIVLPAGAPEDTRARYRDLVQHWVRPDAQVQWHLDNTLTELPADRSVWLFGWSNRFRGALAVALADQDFSLNPARVRVGTRSVDRATDALVVVARHPSSGTHNLAWFASDNTRAFTALARKLPHYGKYSYLVFSGDAPRNVLKGQWPVTDSPLQIRLDDRSRQDSRP